MCKGREAGESFRGEVLGGGGERWSKPPAGRGVFGPSCRPLPPLIFSALPSVHGKGKEMAPLDQGVGAELRTASAVGPWPLGVPAHPCPQGRCHLGVGGEEGALCSQTREATRAVGREQRAPWAGAGWQSPSGPILLLPVGRGRPDDLGEAGERLELVASASHEGHSLILSLSETVPRYWLRPRASVACLCRATQ